MVQQELEFTRTGRSRLFSEQVLLLKGKLSIDSAKPATLLHSLNTTDR